MKTMNQLGRFVGAWILVGDRLAMLSGTKRKGNQEIATYTLPSETKAGSAIHHQAELSRVKPILRGFDDIMPDELTLVARYLTHRSSSDANAVLTFKKQTEDAAIFDVNIGERTDQLIITSSWRFAFNGWHTTRAAAWSGFGVQNSHYANDALCRMGFDIYGWIESGEALDIRQELTSEQQFYAMQAYRLGYGAELMKAERELKRVSNQPKNYAYLFEDKNWSPDQILYDIDYGNWTGSTLVFKGRKRHQPDKIETLELEGNQVEAYVLSNGFKNVGEARDMTVAFGLLIVQRHSSFGLIPRWGGEKAIHEGAD